MTATSLRRWLVVRLEAPLVAFGGVTIDHIGVTRDFPALSAITGLFANALGYDRTERQAHQDLQDRLVFAARREREPVIGVLRDMQNARIYANEEGWTTSGMPEGRNRQSSSFAFVDQSLTAEDQSRLGEFQTHRRERDYHPDAAVLVVVTLRDAERTPTLDDLADALDRPARPLFIGRKPCLPSYPLRHRFANGSSFVEAPNAHAALCGIGDITASKKVGGSAAPSQLRACWPADEGPTETSPAAGEIVDRTVALADRRNWLSGLHGGTRSVVEGRIAINGAAP